MDPDPDFDDQPLFKQEFWLGDDAPDSPIANEDDFAGAFEAHQEQEHIDANIRDQVFDAQAYSNVAVLLGDHVPDSLIAKGERFALEFETWQEAQQAQAQEQEDVEPKISDLPPRMAGQWPGNGDGKPVVGRDEKPSQSWPPLANGKPNAGQVELAWKHFPWPLDPAVDRALKKRKHRGATMDAPGRNDDPSQDRFAGMPAAEIVHTIKDYVTLHNDAVDGKGDDDDLRSHRSFTTGTKPSAKTAKRVRFSLPAPAPSPSPPAAVRPRRPTEQSYQPATPASYQSAALGEPNNYFNLTSPTRATSRHRFSALPPGTSTGPPQPSSLPSNLSSGSSPQFLPVPEHLILRSSSRETPQNPRIRQPNVPDHLILRSSTPISPHHLSHDPEQTVRRAKSNINLGPGRAVSSQSPPEPARQGKTSRVLGPPPTVSSQSPSETTPQAETGHHVAARSENTQEPAGGVPAVAGAQAGTPGNSKPWPRQGTSNSKK